MSSPDDVLGMSVVHGMRGVGGVCEMCMRLVQGDLGGEWIRGLGLGFTNHVVTRGVLDVCLGCSGVGGVCGKLVRACSRLWKVGVVLCLSVLCIGRMSLH